VGVHLPFADDGFDVPQAIDFSIVPAQSAAASNAMGVDISQPLWDGEGVDGKPAPENGFYYLSIPADSKPEAVLETLSSLRGK
jgi:hypothetical protein